MTYLISFRLVTFGRKLIILFISIIVLNQIALLSRRDLAKLTPNWQQVYRQPTNYSNENRSQTSSGNINDSSTIRHLRSKAKTQLQLSKLKENLDIVYTYVNGSDSEHLQRKLQWFKIESKKSDNRIQAGEAIAQGLASDNNELCFSLRSVHRHLKWFTNKIYIVADQIPFWLNIDHPQIQLVSTSEILPTQGLPTFNSHAIESNLHRIPGIKDYFLYFNDDYMLGRDVELTDFFTKEGCPIVYTDERSTTDKNVTYVNLHRQAMWNTNDALQKLGLTNRQRFYLPHAPHLFVKSKIEELWLKAPGLLAKQSTHHFRDRTDIHPAYFFSMYLLEQPSDYCTEQVKMKGRCLLGEDFCIKLLTNNLEDVKTFFRGFSHRNPFPKFFSLNDHTDKFYSKQDAIKKEFSQFLKSKFNTPSPFERVDCTVVE